MSSVSSVVPYRHCCLGRVGRLPAALVGGRSGETSERQWSAIEAALAYGGRNLNSNLPRDAAPHTAVTGVCGGLLAAREGGWRMSSDLERQKNRGNRWYSSAEPPLK